MQHQKILILDFGGQYNQLIARRVRDLGVYCELRPFSMTAEEIAAYAPIGVIFTGGPSSVYEKDAPCPDGRIFGLGIPILGAVPDDEQIVVSTNQGEPLVGTGPFAGQAYLNICRRILGQEVPLMELERNRSLFMRFAGLLKRA